MLPLLARFLPRVFQKRGVEKRNVDKDAETPCLSNDKHDKGKLCAFKIMLLDDTEISLHVKPSGKGQCLIDKVCNHLNLVERDYFGLRYLDHTSQTQWLDPTKAINSQLKTANNVAIPMLYFGVKFYAADPCKLHEEITRYQFFLQVKRDILQGRLPLSFELAAELSALAVQSELGDYDPKRHTSGYISEFRFVPNQSEELEHLITQLHKSMAGQVPAVAEYNYLNQVKWLEMYGVDLHPVQGEGNIEYFLGLTPTGIVVYKNKAKVGNYFWPRISKITFKAKMFMVRVRDKNNEENTYAFECTSKQACKHLWKCCIEHHAFFRLTSASESYSATGRLLGLSSKHRYSGRTEKQILAEMANRPPPKVKRTPSKRYVRRSSTESNPAGFAPLKNSNSENMVSQLSPALAGAGYLHGYEAHSQRYSHGHRRKDGYASAPDSPRSTKSAPWESAHHRGGMFTSGRESPQSVHSEKLMFARKSAHSESESESGHRRRHHRSRKESDTESEVSTRRHRRRSRIPADESGTESEMDHRHRRRSRKSLENLGPSEAQWQDVQRRVRDSQPGGSVTSMQSEPSQRDKDKKKKVPTATLR